MSVVTSRVTERSQTTLPPAVRTVLGIQPGGRIGYVIEGNDVHLVNASSLDHDDPVLTGFLTFLGRDMAKHPDRLSSLPAALVARARAITSGVPIDHSAPIDGVIAL